MEEKQNLKLKHFIPSFNFTILATPVLQGDL